MLTKGKLDTLMSFGLYGLGLLFMQLTDIYVSQNYSKDNIAEWAFFKSAIIILGTICLLGYDQVLVREPQLIQKIFKKFILQAFLISSFLSIIIGFFIKYSLAKTILILICIFLYALSVFVAAASRANFKLWQAQLSTNFWKFLLLPFLFIFSIERVELIYLFAFLLTLILAYFSKGYQPKTVYAGEAVSEPKEVRTIGIAFTLHNIALIIAVYGEQFLVNLKNEISISQHLFLYYSIFTPIALSINGFLGFYFGPKLRRMEKFSTSQYYKLNLKVAFLSFFINVASITVGIGYFYFKNNNLMQLDYYLIAAIFILCYIKSIYTVSSVCLGVFGEKRTLYKTAYLNWAAMIIYIILVFMAMHLFNGLWVARLICLLSVFHWLMRIAISMAFTVKSINHSLFQKEKDDAIAIAP